ncbi:hypothetical protein SDC9_198575 [bioreactor metagenome]|uniref:Uncharacterized protein n=1 Tax=bioreactor metagenome TaxID=1076179 RepID=A0A645II22_9ZZZZ
MITVFYLNIIFGSMVRLKNQFKGVMVKQFLRILSALYVVLLINTFTTTTVAKGNTNAKSAVILLLKASRGIHL